MADGSIVFKEDGTLRLAVRDTPGCLYLVDPRYAEEARRTAVVDGEVRLAVPSGEADYAAPPVVMVSEDDMERVEEELAMALDRHLALRLRRMA